MTLDQCYQANVGKALLIPGGGAGNEGQCVQWADTVLHDVYEQPYHWGNAIDWWNNPGELVNQFDKITDGSVKKGDFVVFNTQVGSEFGHIDVAMQDGTTSNFQGADSNWGGNKTVHLVQHTNPGFVIGSLRLKGGTVTRNFLNEEEVDLAFKIGFNRPASAKEISTYANKVYANDILSTILANNLDFRTKASQYDALKKQLSDCQANSGSGYTLVTEQLYKKN